MAEPATSQLVLFFYTILTGLLAGLIYDFYAGAGYVLRLKKIALHVGDILYWLVLTVLVYSMLWYYNQGEVRFFVLLGLGTGAVLYHHFCRPAVKMVVILGLVTCIRFMRQLWRVCTWLLAGLFFPFQLLFMVLRFPFRLMGMVLGKAGGIVTMLLKQTVPAPVRVFYRRQVSRWREFKAVIKRKK